MADQTRRIRIEVDTRSVPSQMQSVEREFQRIQASTTTAGRDILNSVSGVSGGRGGGDPLASMEARMRRLEFERRQVRRDIEADYRREVTGASDGGRAAYSRMQSRLSEASRTDRATNTQIELLRELIDTIKIQARLEIAENKKAVEQRIRDFDRGKLGELSEPERLKLEAQRRLLGMEEEKKKEAGWMTVAKGVAAERIGEWILGKIGHGAMTLATMQNEEAVMAKAYTAIPFVGEALSAAAERSLELQEQRGMIGSKLAASTGALAVSRSQRVRDGLTDKDQIYLPNEVRTEKLQQETTEMAEEMRQRANLKAERDKKTRTSYKGKSASGEDVTYYRNAYDAAEHNKEMERIDEWEKKRKEQFHREFVKSSEEYRKQWSYTELGLTQIEFMPMAQQLALSTWKGGSALADRTKDIAAISKARGVEMSTLMELAGMQRYSRGGISDTSFVDSFGRIEDIYKRFGIISGGDRSAMQPMLQGLQQIAGSQVGRGITGIDLGQIAGLQGTFSGLGGRFMYNNAEVINSMSQNMAAPANEWQQSMNYQLYVQYARSIGEVPSYVGFKKWQEKGILAPGMMSGRQKMIKDMFGNTEFAAIAEQALYGGLSMEEAEKLAKSGKSFDLVGKGGKAGSRDTYRDLAAVYTTEKEKSQAEITESFTEGMTEGLKEAFSKVGEAMSRKLMASPNSALNTLGEAIKEIMEAFK